MGAKTQKQNKKKNQNATPLTNRSRKFSSKNFLNFLLNGPDKTTLEIFEIFKIEILTIFFFVFVNMGPNGSENFQTLLLLQIAEKQFSNLS